jgi:hypothetical protein
MLGKRAANGGVYNSRRLRPEHGLEIKPGTRLFRNYFFWLGTRGGLATLAAACILAAQLIAAAHVHPWAYVDAFSSAAHGSINEAACPVCVLHAHAPVCATGLPILARPLTIERFFTQSPELQPVAGPKPQLFGRAPPASL